MDAREIAETLERYRALLDSGTLSNDEFELLKARLLSSEDSPHDETVEGNAEPAPEDVAAEEEQPHLKVTMTRTEKNGLATYTATLKDPVTGNEESYPKNYSIPSSKQPGIGYSALADMIEKDTGRKVFRSPKWEVSDCKVDVYFEWGEKRHLDARLVFPETGEVRKYDKHFVFPRNTKTEDFCEGVAGDIERDLGRPVNWHLPEGKADIGPAKIIGIVVGSAAVLFVVVLTVGFMLPMLSNKSGSSSIRKTTTTTRNIDTSYDPVDDYLNAKEFETLKANIKTAGTDLDKIVANGDTSQLKLRRSLVWSALREFEALSVPSKCKTMRDYYVYASEDLVYALDYYYDYFTESKNSGTLANAEACIKEATNYLNIAMDEENDLKN